MTDLLPRRYEYLLVSLAFCPCGRCALRKKYIVAQFGVNGHYAYSPFSLLGLN